MDFDSIVFKRRSIRTFLDNEVSDEDIHKLLEYGHAAPSAGNIQPWEFIVVKNENRKEEIVDTTYIGNNKVDGKPQNWMLKAPVFIVVVANKQRSFDRYGEDAIKTIIYLDASACVQNMLLGVMKLGLSSCYVSGFRKEELSHVLRLPDTHEPIAILPIGYSNEFCFKRPKIELSDITHYETY